MGTFVLYHHPCSDGTASALAAFLKLGNEAEYIGVQYGQRPEIPEGSLVYMLDFSYPRADLEALAAHGIGVVILDHHKTAAEDLAGLPDPANQAYKSHLLSARFDMNKSGCALAWEYFHGTEGGLPWFFKHVQDRDLWRFEFGEATKEFCVWLASFPTTLESYAELYHETKDDLSWAYSQGKAIFRMQEQLVERVCANAHCATIHGATAVIANSSLLQSEVGAELLKKYPGADYAAVWHTGHGTTKYSLRSRGNFDVTEIAKLYGGGGHAAAAGFVMPVGFKFNQG